MLHNKINTSVTKIMFAEMSLEKKSVVPSTTCRRRDLDIFTANVTIGITHDVILLIFYLGVPTVHNNIISVSSDNTISAMLNVSHTPTKVWFSFIPFPPRPWANRNPETRTSTAFRRVYYIQSWWCVPPCVYASAKSCFFFLICSVTAVVWNKKQKRLCKRSLLFRTVAAADLRRLFETLRRRLRRVCEFYPG